jgi:hypothetical protein
VHPIRFHLVPADLAQFDGSPLLTSIFMTKGSATMKKTALVILIVFSAATASLADTKG